MAAWPHVWYEEKIKSKPSIRFLRTCLTFIIRWHSNEIVFYNLRRKTLDKLRVFYLLDVKIKWLCVKKKQSHNLTFTLLCKISLFQRQQQFRSSSNIPRALITCQKEMLLLFSFLWDFIAIKVYKHVFLGSNLNKLPLFCPFAHGLYTYWPYMI